MRVGVYVDGFNLYYGGKQIAGGHGRAGWRWLDLRQLATALLGQHSNWPGAVAERVVYCTARISGRDNPQAQQDQDTYLRALVAAKSVDRIQYGYYAERIAIGPLATRGGGGRPVLATSGWPVCVRDSADQVVPDARFLVSVSRREEKGSDVNVATHLLLDALRGSIDAALVVSNDSDLALPVEEVRKLMPVGVVNPSRGYTAGALRVPQGAPSGSHWCATLTLADLTSAQLPRQVGKLSVPKGW